VCARRSNFTFSSQSRGAKEGRARDASDKLLPWFFYASVLRERTRIDIRKKMLDLHNTIAACERKEEGKGRSGNERAEGYWTRRTRTHFDDSSKHLLPPSQGLMDCDPERMQQIERASG